MTKPFLFDLVDSLYHGVMDNMPGYLQERSMGGAFVLGYFGNYLLFRGIQKLSETMLPEKFNNKHLVNIEKLLRGALIIAPTIYAFTKPENIKYVLTNHPTYASGMIGAGLGALTSATKHINEKNLEEKLKSR
jgi:hypothetical protein